MQAKASDIHAVAGIVLNDKGAILIARRPLSKPLGGLWEFPGGKLEQNESIFAALARELSEEIGITISETAEFMSLQHQYPDRKVLLDVLLVKKYQGKPYGREQQPLAWVNISDLNHYQFPEANLPIVAKLQATFHELIN